MIIDFLDLKELCEAKNVMFNLCFVNGKWFAEFERRFYQGEPDTWSAEGADPHDAIEAAKKKMNN